MAARKLVLLLAVCFTISFISCDVEVPIKEMVNARSTIENARQALADKYDPDNLNKAVEELNKSHTFVVNKKASDAKASAIKAADYAEAAIQASLPKAIDGNLEEAKTLYQDADKLNAAKLAPDQFTAAEAAISDTEKLKGDHNLWDAFAKSKEAVTAAGKAKEAALAKLPGLTEELNAMKKDVGDLKSQKISDQQKKDLDDAASKLDKAGELLAQNNAKEAAVLMGEAGALISPVKMAVQKISARDRIAQLRKEVEQLKKARGSELAGEDIAVITASLNEAESLLDQEKTEEALKKISDAEQLLAAAKEKTIKALALDKVKALEKMLEEARKKDTDNKHKTEIDNAATMINDGKKLLESGSYAESLAKFEEAESILKSLGIAGEKGRLADDGSLINQEGKKIYKVIYNKNRRDCLWRIAGKVYKNARLWPLIYVANKSQIKDPDLIFPGQRFVIPEVPAPKEKTDKKEKSEGVKEDTGKDKKDTTESTDTTNEE
jgi:nucleoid-associated protein YgaU